MPEAKTELQWAATANPNSAKARDVLASWEKVETTDSPKPLPPIDQPKRLPSIAASSPEARPPIHRQFNQVPPAAEPPGHAAIASRPARALETAPDVANAGSRLSQLRPPRQVAITSKPAPQRTHRLMQRSQTSRRMRSPSRGRPSSTICLHTTSRPSCPIIRSRALPRSRRPRLSSRSTGTQSPATPNVERPNTHRAAANPSSDSVQGPLIRLTAPERIKLIRPG